MKVPDELRDADRNRIGFHDGKVSTYGYRYVLPVRFAYRSAADEGVEQIRYSFLSLNRSGSHPELVAGEYGRGDATTRLLSYPLDPDSMHLVPGEDGLARPVLLEQGGVGNMQGAAVVGGRWYVTRSRGPWGLGSLYVGTRVASGATGGRCRWDRRTSALAVDEHALVGLGVAGAALGLQRQAVAGGVGRVRPGVAPGRAGGSVPRDGRWSPRPRSPPRTSPRPCCGWRAAPSSSPARARRARAR